ncbi:DUF131 domain-containing protein [Infirmifilum lucidum]|uniref:DUF131 domain-containing protein n=1 Tax=Infirmifilum lucidum TaxID=2776706 RepID=A0A7L9FKF9_9CREN|nr:DUF131 domain-containing protein [Infirmifilum lucidum]QOJ79424.1 DUF131 domain-containing protein [Infirmifilum lucidum]
MRAEEIGALVVLLGVMLIMAGIVLAILGSATQLVGIGGCVFIGPFPLCFGYGQNPLLVVLASIAMALAMIIATYILFSGSVKSEKNTQG